METPPKPEPPEGLPQYIVDALDRQGAQSLEQISRYAQDIAKWEVQKAESELEDDEEVVHETSEDVGDLPDDVPSKASIVVKQINGNRYYYYQWRDGDKVKSQYKSPVDPDN